jgi:hypothetical protein
MIVVTTRRSDDTDFYSRAYKFQNVSAPYKLKRLSPMCLDRWVMLSPTYK